MEEYHIKAMEEVMRGCEFAEQLQQLLLNNNTNNFMKTPTSIFVQHLVNNVINSFNNTIFLMSKENPSDQIQKEFSSIAPLVRSVDFKENWKKTSATRGCNKKRNITQTWEKVTETPTDDDGHQWRKYGKKKINNSPYLRNYYRCTHKFDQRCLTTKHVHRIQQKPPLYKTTYYGHHTCGNVPNPDIILDPNDSSSMLLSFNNTFPTPTKQECPFLSSPSSFSSTHSEDYNDEVPSSTLVNTNLPCSDLTLHNSTLEYGHNDMMHGLLYDTVQFNDHFFQPFDGFVVE